ncbi:MAG: HlyD family secretion protein, partial [Caulobacteraceae bacterium]
VAAGGDAAGSLDPHPAVLQAQAALDRARLQLGYTEVRAPQDGVVTKVEQIQLGSYITAAQPLFWLVSGRPYVEADFKEDQLARMRAGQAAEIEIDAYGGKTLPGHVASFSPGAGSTFSILPPQNATGNWVKVVQRLPVRIEFDQTPPVMAAAGLSAKVKVDPGPKGEGPPPCSPAATRARPTSGRSPSASCWRRSWSRSTPPSPTWPCPTSRAASRPRRTRSPGS